MRLVSWNVNSIRARVPLLVEVLDRLDPDVVLLQETRCHDGAFPFEVFVARGFEVAHHGTGHRNGVAIASRVGLYRVQRGFDAGGVVAAACAAEWDDDSPPIAPAGCPADALTTEARLISATCGGVRCHSVYVPNGREIDHEQYHLKLAWLRRLRDDLVDFEEPTVVAGDLNIAPADIDIYDPARWRGQTHASPAERAALARLIDVGLHDVMRDLDPSAGLFTWWNYLPGQFERNRGLRIDLFLVSAAVAARAERCWIDRQARRPDARPSDHAPVVLDLDHAPVGPGADLDLDPDLACNPSPVDRRTPSIRASFDGE